MKKRLLALVLVMMLVITSLTACGGGKDAIVGHWEMSTISMMGTEMNVNEFLSTLGMDELEMNMDIESNGDLKMNFMGDEATGTWKADGSSFILTIDGDDAEVKMDGGKLVLELEGEKMTFEKK